MSRLFIDLYLDEDVDVLVAELVQARGFEVLAQKYFEAGRDYPGIIFAARRSPQEIARRLLLILNDVPAEEMRNQVRYI